MAGDDSKALKLVRWICDQAIEGVPPLSSAKDLAQEYKIDRGYPDDDSRVASLVNWETSKNFTSGFITGLGGLLTLPVAVPAALGASWVIQARMAGAIAAIYGHSLSEDRVRTLVLLSLVGDSAKEILKQVGIQAGFKAAKKAIVRVPGRILIAINKKIGFRLIAKTGSTAPIRLVKLVPLVGGLVGGAFDAVSCRAVGYAAKRLFRPPDGSDADEG
jgi:uncharacterized protein (DUF697 family)